MHDINFIRENPTAFDAGLKRRGLDGHSSQILELDRERRALLTDIQTMQARRNEASKEIGAIKSKGGDASSLMTEVSTLKEKIAEAEQNEISFAQKLEDILSAIPNLLDPTIPDGPDESANVEIHKWGDIKATHNIDHVDIGESLGLLDFETAAKMSGARFTLLKGDLARLERALGQFMLDTHCDEHGYTQLSGPLMVRDQAMFGTGQLPKFRDDQFLVNTGHWLIPTSEVTLTNTVMDAVHNETDFPCRYTSFTPCFRAEAGAAGKDTRGMIRQHQFYKVELVSITLPEHSDEEHERMTNCAENILKKLELPFRRIVLCSGDTGFCARKTYDLEVWLPAQNTYREISSCSNTGDFQARRMKARFKRNGAKDTEFLHTLNGSGVAVGRALVAVLENYYDPADGGVFIPNVLKSYMGGKEKILPLNKK